MTRSDLRRMHDEWKRLGVEPRWRLRFAMAERQAAAAGYRIVVRDLPSRDACLVRVDGPDCGYSEEYSPACVTDAERRILAASVALTDLCLEEGSR